MSEVGMGLCCKEQVGVDIVKFWLSKDYREMMVTFIAPPCVSRQSQVGHLRNGDLIYLSRFLGT